MVEVHFEAVVHREDGSFALVSSALTGPIWDGSLWVFKSFAEFQACPNVFLTNTRVNAGMSDAIWLDQTRLLVALDTGELEVWSSMPLGGGLELKGSLKSHDDMALCLCHHGDRESGHVVSGGADGRVLMWDVQKERPVRSYKGHMDMVLSVACEPQSEIFLSSSQDGTVRLWDTRLSKPAKNFKAAKEGVYTSMAWSSEFIALGNESGVVQVVDPRNDHFLFATYRPHTREVRRLSFFPLHSNVLASVSDDCTAHVQSLTCNKTLYSSSSHKDFIRGLSWESSGDSRGCSFLTCGWDGQVLRHDLTKWFKSSDSSGVLQSGRMETEVTTAGDSIESEVTDDQGSMQHKPKACSES